MQDIIKTIIDNWGAILVIVIAFIAFIFGNRVRGFLGELKTSNILNKLPRNDYKVFNDLMLFSDNKMHQLDHVVVSKYGIFVIEMKNYQGRVEGNEFSDNWTQYIGSKVNKFYNPVKQNYGHMRCLSDVLDLNMNYFISLIVFSNETDIDSNLDYVVNLDKTIKFIMKHRKKMDIDIDDVCATLVKNNITDRKERSKHVAKLKNNVKEDNKKANSGICPKCDSKMIVKEGKYGKYLACSKCKYTKDL